MEERKAARCRVLLCSMPLLRKGSGTGEIAVLSYAAEHALLALIDERQA